MKNQLTLILVLFTFMVFGQQQENQEKFNDLKTQIKELNLSTKADINLTNEKLNNLNGKITDMELKLSNIEERIWSERFGWLAGGATIVFSILGLLLAWFGFKKLLEKKANAIFEEHLINRFKDLKEEDIEILYKEIESSAWKNQIRSKKILVINQKDTELPDDFKTALKVFNPEYKDVENIKEAIELDYSDYSLVIVENNEDVGFWSLEDYKDDFISLADKICGQNVSFIYYSGKLGRFPTTSVNTHLVNYSNSPSTLYNNIMNTLKFKDLLETS